MQALFKNGQEENIDLGAKQCAVPHLWHLFCTSDTFYLGILVRNDVTKARLEERFPTLGRNNFMSVLVLLLQLLA